MKNTIALLLLLSLLLSLLSSCQGTAPSSPAETLPQTQTLPQEPSSAGQTLGEQTPSKTEEYPFLTAEAFLLLDQTQQTEYALRLLELLKNGKTSFQTGEEEVFTTGITTENGVPQGYFIPREIQVALEHLTDVFKYTTHVWTTDSQNGKEVNVSQLIYEYLETIHRTMREAGSPITILLEEEGDTSFIYQDGAYILNRILYFYTDNGQTKEYSLPDRKSEHRVIFIAPYAFANNKVLERVNLGDGCWEFGIGEQAFINCPNLKTLNVSTQELSYPTIAESFYDRYYSLLRKTPKNNLFVEGDYNKNCNLLSRYPTEEKEGETTLQALYRTRKESVASLLVTQPVDANPDHYVIHDGVLIGYLGLGGHLVIPEGVTEIRSDVFYTCQHNVLSVTLPSTLKKICTYAFVNTLYLPEIEIPAGVEVIETQAIVSPYDESATTFELATYAVNIPEGCEVAKDACTFVWPVKKA